MVEQFTVHSWELTLSITPCNLEISSVKKYTPRKTLQPLWKGPYQEQLTRAELQGIDCWIHVTHLKKKKKKKHYTLTGAAYHLVP